MNAGGRELVLTINLFLEPVYDEIENIVFGLEMASPTQVAAVMKYRDANLIRRDMHDLWRAGRLVIADGNMYRLPNPLEKLMFSTSGWRTGHQHITEYSDLVYEAIETAVGKAQRDLRRGVLPRDIQARLPYNRAEGSLRRDCLALYEAGRLVRVGGHGARRGYRLPTKIERMSFSLNHGMWPHGAEFVGSWA